MIADKICDIIKKENKVLYLKALVGDIVYTLNEQNQVCKCFVRRIIIDMEGISYGLGSDSNLLFNRLDDKIYINKLELIDAIDKIAIKDYTTDSEYQIKAEY